MFTINERQYLCPLQLSLSLISGKWKGIIIWFLLDKETLRYGQIKKLIAQNSSTSITEKMLIQSLKELEKDGLVQRKVYPVVPPKVEYSLTAQGETLKPIIDKLEEFGCGYEKP